MRLRLSNGLSLGYRTRGAGRLVVLLHPVGTRGEFWDPVVDLLETEYRTIAVDFRGHGESDTPRRGFSLEDLADDVIELLKVQDAEGAVVIGCSLGGMVTQAIALKAPELLSAIVIADTGYMQTDQTRQAMTERARAARNGMPTVVASTLERWSPADFRASHPEVVERIRGWLLSDDPTVFAWCWEAIRDLNHGERLAAVHLPALVIRGSEDASARRDTMQAMAKLLPRGRFVEIPGAGHVAPLEQPAQFVALVREFLERDAGLTRP